MELVEAKRPRAEGEFVQARDSSAQARVSRFSPTIVDCRPPPLLPPSAAAFSDIRRRLVRCTPAVTFLRIFHPILDCAALFVHILNLWNQGAAETTNNSTMKLLRLL